MPFIWYALYLMLNNTYIVFKIFILIDYILSYLCLSDIGLAHTNVLVFNIYTIIQK